MNGDCQTDAPESPLGLRWGRSLLGITHIVSDLTEAALFGSESTQEGAGALEEAKTFLRWILADGPLSANRILEEAHGQGIAPRTLQRAKTLLNHFPEDCQRRWLAVVIATERGITWNVAKIAMRGAWHCWRSWPRPRRLQTLDPYFPADFAICTLTNMND